MPWVRNNDGDWVWEDEPPPPPNWNSPEYQSPPGPQVQYDVPVDPGTLGGWLPWTPSTTIGGQTSTYPYQPNEPLYGPPGAPVGWTPPASPRMPNTRLNRYDRETENREPGWPTGYHDPTNPDTSYPQGSPARPATGAAPSGGGGGPTGGGGGGWSPPPPPDPLAWMNDFGGKDFIKMFLKKPGEKLADYYARLGGDPVKTLIAKYQEIKGMDPDMNMRSLAIGALGLTGMIDPTTLEEVFSMPQSDYLGRLMKAGPSMANLTRFKTPSGGGQGGLRTLKGNDWWSMSNSMRTWAPVEAAKPPTFTAV